MSDNKTKVRVSGESPFDQDVDVSILFLKQFLDNYCSWWNFNLVFRVKRNSVLLWQLLKPSQSSNSAIILDCLQEIHETSFWRRSIPGQSYEAYIKDKLLRKLIQSDKSLARSITAKRFLICKRLHGNEQRSVLQLFMTHVYRCFKQCNIGMPIRIKQNTQMPL